MTRSFAVAAALAVVFANNVAAHATFQQLWVDGVDYGTQCSRYPVSNSPVTNVASNDIRCNVGTARALGKCPAKAGSTVTVEMHAQSGDRKCSNQAIGGAHWGPVMVYMTKVDDASTADGSTGWFKVFQDSWAKAPSSTQGDGDYWGTKDLNDCCGRMDVKIPADIPAGDYLLRAEAIALHASGSLNGAQFYMTCYELTVDGSGTATPPTVTLPGAYSASDPGILVNIHTALQTYIAPGPAVYAGGSTKVAGSGCTGCESKCSAGASPAATVSLSPVAPAGSGGGGGGCTVAMYGQCGGNGYTGCTNCMSGQSCKDVSPPYYAQCA